jgi:hypothetical protein
MPVFRIFSFKGLIIDFLLQLMQKSVLGTHTEVTDSQEAHFFEDKLTG